jgi:hypothetical protein
MSSSPIQALLNWPTRFDSRAARDCVSDVGGESRDRAERTCVFRSEPGPGARVLDPEIDWRRLGIVYTVNDGLIVRGREYASRAEALEAAGLSE